MPVVAMVCPRCHRHFFNVATSRKLLLKAIESGDVQHLVPCPNCKGQQVAVPTPLDKNGKRVLTS